MPPAPQTPAQAAEAFYRVALRVLSDCAPDEYGIALSTEQAFLLSRELLSVTLYWVHAALGVALPSEADAQRIFGSLTAIVREKWHAPLGFQGQDVEAYLAEMEERRATYRQIEEEGGAPVAVLTETTAILESAGAVRPEDQPKLLALLIDLVPVDEIGEMATAIRLAGA
ncbi:MAG: hypothetical protein AB1411_09585 [Nitrospirota bacterium]